MGRWERVNFLVPHGKLVTRLVIKWVESERCVGRVNFLVAHNNQNIGYEIG